MPKSNQTAIRPAESVPDSFDALRHRLLSVMSRMQCVVENFGDFTGMQNELDPAAFVLAETVDDVVRFHRDLEGWHMGHEHTPKAAKEAQS